MLSIEKIAKAGIRIIFDRIKAPATIQFFTFQSHIKADNSGSIYYPRPLMFILGVSPEHFPMEGKRDFPYLKAYLQCREQTGKVQPQY